MIFRFGEPNQLTIRIQYVDGLIESKNHFIVVNWEDDQSQIQTRKPSASELIRFYQVAKRFHPENGFVQIIKSAAMDQIAEEMSEAEHNLNILHEGASILED